MVCRASQLASPHLTPAGLQSTPTSSRRFSQHMLLRPYSDSNPTSDKTVASTSTTRLPLHTALCYLPMLTGPGDEMGASPWWCCAELANPSSSLPMLRGPSDEIRPSPRCCCAELVNPALLLHRRAYHRAALCSLLSALCSLLSAHAHMSDR